MGVVYMRPARARPASGLLALVGDKGWPARATWFGRALKHSPQAACAREFVSTGCATAIEESRGLVPGPKLRSQPIPT